MITLAVTSFNGAAVSDLAFAFDELGGTVGRAPTNQLVLPDPERSISRVQAQVGFRAGSYFLTARGAVAVVHNGKPLVAGAEVSLVAGDQIEIGGYRIAVSGATPADSHADPFEAAFGNARPVAPVPAAVRSGGGKPASTPADSLSTHPSVVGRGKSSGVGIPDDWDPFVDTKADPFNRMPDSGAAGQVAGAAPQGAPLVAQTSRESSLDAMFGLKAGSTLGDPLAASPLAPGTEPALPGPDSDGRLGALMRPARAGAEPVSDHVSDLNAPWANAPKTLAAATPAAAALPGAVLSWDLPKPDSTLVARRPASAESRPSGPSAPRPAHHPTAAPASRPEPVADGAGPPLARDAELLAALQEGLGAVELRMGPLTPELLRLVGQLLRESTRGTVELLAARAALKREVRADVTTILANSNNSLKFSPSAEVALQYLLGPRVSGFLPPVESMRDAYDDLRAHQLGVMAGVKAALSGVVQRFDPAVVERKLSAAPGRTSLIPSSRKARLWELFEELYRQLAAEADEDFNSLFGDTFLKAYQQYIDQLESRSEPRH